MLTRVFTAGYMYFAVVFAAGFLFGVIRTVLVVPWVGERAAELGEMPLMAVVIVGAAAWVVRRRRLGGASRGARLAVGVIGALLVLAFEALLVVTLRGESVTAYVQAKDPLIDIVYLALIALMAVMPAFINSRRPVRESTSATEGRSFFARCISHDRQSLNSACATKRIRLLTPHFYHEEYEGTKGEG